MHFSLDAYAGLAQSETLRFCILASWNSHGRLHSDDHVGRDDARPGEGLFAVQGRRAAHVAFHEGQAGTPRAGNEVRTRRAHRQVTPANGAHLVHLPRVPPDLEKRLSADVAGGQRELHARVDISVRRNVAEGMAGAARQPIQSVVMQRPGRRAELVHVTYHLGIAKQLLQVAAADS